MNGLQPEYYIKRIKLTSKGGALVERGVMYAPPCEGASGRAGTEITELKEASRKKLAFVASNAVRDWSSMFTLTYARDYPTDGREVKADLNRFLTSLRYYLPDEKYLWFLEFQKRGAPHMHVLSTAEYDVETSERLGALWSKTVLKKGDYDDRYVRWVTWFNGTSRAVVGAVGCQFWQQAKRRGGLGRYAVKYATKTEQKKPKKCYRSVGRFWGSSRNLVEYTDTIEYNYGDIRDGDAEKIIAALFPDKPLNGVPKFIFGSG